MNYFSIYQYFEEKSFNYSGVFIRMFLIKGLKNDRGFLFLSNSIIEEFSKRKNFILPNTDQDLIVYKNLFNNRSVYYNSNSEKNIITNELLKKYEKDKIKEKISFKELIYKIAVYEGLDKVLSIFRHKNDYYSLLYEKGLINTLIFSKDIDKINVHKKELNDKYFPKSNVFLNLEKNKFIPIIDRKENNREEKDKIILNGIELNVYEFVFYIVEWNRYITKEFYAQNINPKDLNIPLREIYDKILIDFQDPFNSNQKPYNTTKLYKALKEMSKDKIINNKIDKYVAYQKILQLILTTKNKKFKSYINLKISKEGANIYKK